MKAGASHFKENARRALHDPQLQSALSALPTGLVANRRRAVAALPEFENLREEGKRIRDETLTNLDLYLEAFAENSAAAGAEIHWAADAGEARAIIADICRKAGAGLVAKGKSMVSEEIDLNRHLAGLGMEVVETDLGEYIVQRRAETPSHIIAPAIHVTEREVADHFREWHRDLDPERALDDPASLVREARTIMRRTFLGAKVGITGANFLVAETGSAVIVTNEGNGDLTQTLPPVHIVLAGIEKVVPTLADTSVLLRLLARSATGQDITAYTTFATGARRADDLDGPSACHIVLLDNGRTEMLSGTMRDALRCIRCGACMNHCPVYNAIGGHAYGWIYPGPIGAVLTPAHLGIAETHDLPTASTFCGTCESVCPVKIPLVSLMRSWRERHHEAGGGTWASRLMLRAWVALAQRPALYRLTTGLAASFLARAAGRRRKFGWMPLAVGWTRYRDLPAPSPRTFQAEWKARQTRGRS